MEKKKTTSSHSTENSISSTPETALANITNKLFTDSSCGILICNANGDIVIYNQAFKEIFQNTELESKTKISEIEINISNNQEPKYLKLSDCIQKQFHTSPIRCSIANQPYIARTTITKDKKSLAVSFQKFETIERENENLIGLNAESMTFADQLPQVVFEVDENLNILFLNNAGLKILGFSLEQIKNRQINLKDYIAPEDKDRFLKSTNRLLRGESISGNAYTGILPGNKRICLQTYSSPVYRDGKPIGLRGIALDVGKQREQEESLRRSEQNMRFLAEATLNIAKFHTEEEIFSYVADQLYKVNNENGILIITEINEENLSWEVKEFRGLTRLRENVKKIVGRDIAKFKGHADPSITNKLKNGKLVSLGNDLSFISAGFLSHTASNLLVKLFSISNVNSISFTNGFKNFGNLALVSFKGSEKIQTGLIEAFVQTVSFFLEKRIAEKNEARIQKSFYQLFIESSDPVMLFKDKQINDCNNAMINFMDTTDKNELIGKSLLDFSPEFQPDGNKSKDLIDQYFTKAIQQTHSRFEWMISDTHGTSKWIDITLTKLTEHNNSNVYSIWRDITNQKYTEAKLRRSELRYRQIFQNSLLGIYRSNPEGKLLAVNPSFSQILAYENEEELFSNIHNVDELYYQPEQRKLFKEQLELQGNVKGFEVQMINKLGKNIWISINAKRMLDKVLGTYYEGTIEDITQRKTWEKLLIESEERYRILFENSSDANLILDNDRILSCNEKFLDLFKYNSSEEVVGLSPWDFSPEFQPGGVNSIQLAKRMIQEAYDKGVKRFEWLHINQQDEELWFDISLTLITQDGSKKLHVVMRDITEKINIEEELRAYRENLQLLVDERTEELKEKNIELERMNSLFVGREFRIKELRDKVKLLENENQSFRS